MFDQRLLRAINRGRCFVLVGSGPSCELGYPSWERLARRTYEKFAQDGLINDKHSYEDFLSRRMYPELFRQAEVDIGDRAKLVDVLKSFLVPAENPHGFIYEMLSRWPFACYLTTNFDDELANYLGRTGEHFSVLRNRREDFYAIRDGATHLIQKLHSDLNHPNEVVITSADYRKLYIDDEGQYFCVKLQQTLAMFDVFIIGHSLSDPDIDYVLKIAKKTASPLHPIYMVATGFNWAEERELLEKYNMGFPRFHGHSAKPANFFSNSTGLI